MARLELCLSTLKLVPKLYRLLVPAFLTVSIPMIFFVYLGIWKFNYEFLGNHISRFDTLKIAVPWATGTIVSLPMFLVTGVLLHILVRGYMPWAKQEKSPS